MKHHRFKRSVTFFNSVLFFNPKLRAAEDALSRYVNGVNDLNHLWFVQICTIFPNFFQEITA
jgi:hypothetical protein